MRSTSISVSAFQKARVVFGQHEDASTPHRTRRSRPRSAPVCTILKFWSATAGLVFCSSSAFSAAISARTIFTTSTVRCVPGSKAVNRPGCSSRTKRPSRARNARSSSLTTTSNQNPNLRITFSGLRGEPRPKPRLPAALHALDAGPSLSPAAPPYTSGCVRVLSEERNAPEPGLKLCRRAVSAKAQSTSALPFQSALGKPRADRSGWRAAGFPDILFAYQAKSPGRDLRRGS